MEWCRGVSPQLLQSKVFQQLKGFGEYGFPESHAASFALLVYVSAWLKAHYPAAFTASLLGSQPMGFYAPSQLVRDAQEHGVTVLPVCVQSSEWHATLETSGKSLPALRLGFEQVHGLGETIGSRIDQARKSGLFMSVQDFTRRCHATQSQLLSLARAGALKSLAGDRRQAIWDSMERNPEPGSMPLFEAGGCLGLNEMKSGSAEIVDLPTTSPLEDVLSDYRTSGLSLVAHPLQFSRQDLTFIRYWCRQNPVESTHSICTHDEHVRFVLQLQLVTVSDFATNRCSDRQISFCNGRMIRRHHSPLFLL